MQSPTWGTDDSGAVQGFAFFMLSAILGLIYVAIGFPLLAIKLENSFTTRKWVWSNILGIFISSYLASCIFCYFIGVSSIASVISESLVLSLLIWTIGLVFLAPAMFIFLRLANISHNNRDGLQHDKSL